MPHVHSDLCWPDTPEVCINSCMLCIDDTVTYSARASDYKFTMEHMMFLKEYLRRNPEKRDTVKRLLEAGHLDCGASHSGPTELTLGGEGLIRELYLGKMWLENEFGIGSSVVWNVDVPGHTAQLPQILAKAGVDCFFFWKTFFWDKNYGGYAGPHYFIWEALDGSRVTACSVPYGYGLGDMVRIKEDYELFDASVQPFIDKIFNETEAAGIPPYILIADGNDIARPSFAPIENINTWNERRPQHKMRLVSSTEFAAMLRGKDLPVSKGEMPCWWDTVMSFETERVLTDRWAEGALLSAECAAAFADLVNPDYEIPRYDIHEAWDARLFACEHNEGGYMGHLSDSLKEYKVKAASHLAFRTGRRALSAVAQQIEGSLDTGFVLFNSLSWARKCQSVLSFEFQHNDLPPRNTYTGEVVLTDKQLSAFSVCDEQGREVPCEFTSLERGSDGALKKASVLVNVDLEGGQYRTFGLVPNESPSTAVVAKGVSVVENEFYRVEMDASCGALSSIYDKVRGRELLDTSKYLGAELVTNEDLGHDETEEFTGKVWRMKDHPARISVSTSPVRTVLRSKGAMVGCERSMEVVLYPGSDAIDVSVKIDWQGVRDLNMRVAFPFALESPEMRYGVPFGWVKHGEEHPDSTNIHPSIRGVRDWFDLSEQDFGITVLTEVIPIELADRVSPEAEGILAQPLLLRSTYSCYDHIFSNNNRPIDDSTDRNTRCQFSKGGEFTFHFCIRPHDGVVKPEAAARQAWEFLHPPVSAYVENDNIPYATAMRPIKRATRTGGGPLPVVGSFVRSASDGVVHTLTKPAEDGKGIILRMYDASGKGGKITFEFDREVGKAHLTDIIEKNVKPLKAKGRTLVVDVPAFSIETVRVELA